MFIQYRSLCMESSDADDLICPPPPLISKVSMSIGMSTKPAKVNEQFIAIYSIFNIYVREIQWENVLCIHSQYK